MKNAYYLFPLLLSTSLLVKAQTNYIINSANASAPGSFNTIIGPGAGNTTMTGGSNAFIGADVGIMNTIGANNVFMGHFAGYSNKSGYANAFVGYQTGFYNTTGGTNTFMGYYAGQRNTTGYSNLSVGVQAGYLNQMGHSNVMLGDSAGFSNTVSNNLFIGSKAGYASVTAAQNTFVGYQAGYSTTASSNTFMGFNAGRNTSSGQANVFVGSEAGLNNTEGLGNMFLGQQAGANNKTGNYNLFIGNSAGFNSSIGTGNTAIGDGSGLHITTGQRNVSIGQYAGLNNQTGSDNVFIGYGTKAGTNNPTNLTNAIAIGANAVVNQDNTMVLGNAVNVGIGTSVPGNKLEINAGTFAFGKSGLRFTQITSYSGSEVTTNKFLTVNSVGDVVLGTVGSGGREGAAETGLWQRNGHYLQSSQEYAVIIGQGIGKMPTGYKLFVDQGILTEKIKVAVKNTADWSDKVFAPTYRLQSLQEVERYIQVNQHLPGVASAKEMVQQGNDLHKTDAKLLEKIEELTLYSIQLEKANQQQKVELKVIKQEQAQLKQLMEKLLKKWPNHD